MKTYKSERAFQTINNVALLLISLSMILPLIHLLAVSLSSARYAEAKLVYLWPKGFTFEGYRQIMLLDTLWQSMGISAFITVVGCLVTLALSASLSFALAREKMPAKSLILKLILITFIFPAPLIPFYLLVKNIGMMNTLWALIIPGATGAFYIIIMRTFFRNISSELYDASKIDGCSEFGNFWRVAIPLSMPVIATIALFHAVGQWNSYFSAMIFIRDKSLWPLQLTLRNMIVESGVQTDNVFDMSGDRQMTPQILKAGIIIFTTIPILIVYPFLQKYFVKGAMLGSLKE